MAKEPSQFEMKKQFNLPEDAVFGVVSENGK